MAIILPPKITGDSTEDSWNFSVEQSNNELDSRVSSLESDVDALELRIANVKAAAIALSDTATTLQVLTLLRNI